MPKKSFLPDDTAYSKSMAVAVFAILAGLIGFGVIAVGNWVEVNPIIYLGTFIFGCSFLIAVLSFVATFFFMIRRLLGGKG